jgi:hypothetical protein
MIHKARVSRAISAEVAPSLREAQQSIRAPADHIRICIILAIILPPAHRAQLEGSRSGQRPAPAAQATNIRGLHSALDDAEIQELRKIFVQIP